MLIKKSITFHAAHRNKEAGKKCARIHGHTYKVTLIVNSPYNSTDSESGISTHFDKLGRVLDNVKSDLDHYFILKKDDPLVKPLLNLAEPIVLIDFPTSAENLAELIVKIIQDDGLPVWELELQETTTSSVIIQPHNKID